nr:hypothetical protein [Herbidospora galbida]
MRGHPLTERRRRLEELFAHVPTTGLLALSMQTADLAEALLWMEILAPKGTEGLMIKAAADPYRPGVRGWWKYKTRITTEMIVGGVTGTLPHPQDLILGRTSRLHDGQAAELADHLHAAHADHPWPELLPPRWAGLFSSATPLSYVRVHPDVVVEVLADVARDHGRWRHPLRFLRLRPDLSPEAVPHGFDT